jgi:hypothetical protein
LAEILVNFDIALPGNWEKSGRDATKYLLLTLERWVRMHGGLVIDRRFDLDLTLSDRLVDYSDERGPEGTLYLVLDPDSAAFVLLTPTIELLENVHPRLPVTFYSHFAGALNRWVRVYDYHDAEERVEMLREWYEGEENAVQTSLSSTEKRCSVGTPDKQGKTMPLGAAINLSAAQILLVATSPKNCKRREGNWQTCVGPAPRKRPQPFREEGLGTSPRCVG